MEGELAIRGRHRNRPTAVQRELRRESQTNAVALRVGRSVDFHHQRGDGEPRNADQAHGRRGAMAPEAFANVAAADRIVTANREALETCRKTATRTKKEVRCTIVVGTER